MRVLSTKLGRTRTCTGLSTSERLVLPLLSVSKPSGFHPLHAWITAIPLLAGLASLYGPVAYNYGIALYFLNYSHGFVKRGLVGELMLPLGHLTRSGIVALQVGFILAAFAATYLVFRSLFFGTLEDRTLAALLFAGPALLPHLAFLFAQPDVTLYLLLLAAVAATLRLSPVIGAFAATALCCIALLAHEAFSLAFYPLLIAILWDRTRRRALPWAVALMQPLIVLAAFLAILHFGTLKVSPEIILADASLRTAVPLQRQVFDVMASTFAQQRALVRGFYSRWLWTIFGFSLLIAAPYFLLLGRLLARAVAALEYRLADRLVLAALFLLPLSLCYLGHDVSRWISACAIDVTLFLGYLLVTSDAVRRTLRAWATGIEPFVWLAGLLIIGPFGATGLRLVEQTSVLWGGK